MSDAFFSAISPTRMPEKSLSRSTSRINCLVSIANGGKKVQPKLVNTATEVNTDYTVYENKTQVLSALPGSKEDLETIQMGFREVVAGEHAIDLSSHWMYR